jgi:DNA-binding Lrp family transcriptional regulator
MNGRPIRFVKKWERVLRQILYLFYEENARFMKQKAIAETCGVSLGSVNPVMKKLDRLGAIEKKPLGFRVSDVGRIILYWANIRDLAQDITLRVNTGMPTEKIEETLPRDSILTAYSAFRKRFGKVIENHHEVHVYANAADIKRKFGEGAGARNTIVVLKPDTHLSSLSEGGLVPIGQMYVDLWQLGTPAKVFIDYLNTRMKLIEMGTLKRLIRKVREGA